MERTWVTMLGTRCGISQLIARMILQGSFYYYAHFTAEETDTPKVNCPRSHNYGAKEPDLTADTLYKGSRHFCVVTLGRCRAREGRRL